MERITGKQVQSMMEALHQVYAQQEQVEVEQLTEAPSSGGYGSGVVGQVQRLGAKMFGDASAVNKAVSYERSIDALTKSRGGGNVALGADGKPITAAQIDAETKRRRLADPNYKAGQGVDSGAKPVLGGNKPPQPNPKPNPKPGKNPPPKPAPPAQTVTAKNASGQQQQVTVGRKYEATLGGQKGTVTYDAAGKRTFTANKPVAGDTAPAKPTGNTAADKTTTPAAKPVPTGTTADGTKFERRLPTMAELRAAQAARAAAKAAGTDRAGQEAAAVKAGVTQAQRQASVDASIKAARARDNAPAPAGSALRAQQDRLAAQKAATTAANTTTAANKLSGSGALAPTGAKPVPTTTSTSAAPKPVGTPIQGGVKPVAGAPTAPAANTKFGTAPAPKPAAAAPAPKVETKKKPLQTQSADLFDIVKGELLDEGYSEEDAMYIMANLDAEQREIVMNEGIGALLKLGAKALNSGAGKKVLSKAANLIKGGKKGASDIGKRARRVVTDQRAGVMGSDDALNQGQQALDKSMSRLRRQDLRSTAGASLNAKALESQVRRAAAYGPQTSLPPGKVGVMKIEPPKPTGGKVGLEMPKQAPSYNEVMARNRAEFAGKTQAEKDEIFNSYIKRWKENNK